MLYPSFPFGFAGVGGGGAGVFSAAEWKGDNLVDCIHDYKFTIIHPGGAVWFLFFR